MANKTKQNKKLVLGFDNNTGNNAYRMKAFGRWRVFLLPLQGSRRGSVA